MAWTLTYCVTLDRVLLPLWDSVSFSLRCLNWVQRWYVCVIHQGPGQASLIMTPLS